MMEISKFCLENLFHSRKLEDGDIAYWRECKDPETGWIIIWKDGGSVHTYHDPGEGLE